MSAESLNRNRRGRDTGLGRHGLGVGEFAPCEGIVAGIFVAADCDGRDGGGEGLFDRGGIGAADHAEKGELAELW